MNNNGNGKNDVDNNSDVDNNNDNQNILNKNNKGCTQKNYLLCVLVTLSAHPKV